MLCLFQWEALAMWATGLSLFGVVAYAAKINDKKSWCPHVRMKKRERSVHSISNENNIAYAGTTG
jgi:hypothetical protein